MQLDRKGQRQRAACWGSVLALAAVAACSNGGGSGPPVMLCDGTAGIRFLFRNIGGGAQLPGSGIMFEDGTPLLIIMATCEFWAAEDFFHDVRAGILSGD